MISKLPSWVWTGAWLLAFIAGFINVVGLLGIGHQAVTHLTGTTSLLAAAVASGNRSAILHSGGILASFFAGAVFSGFLIQDSTLKLGRRYGVALLFEAFLLCLAVPLLNHGSISGICCTAGACGLQNAMVSTYSGTVVRTTHLSGMFTDLGIFVGHSLRRVPVDTRRLRLCILIISGFFVGGTVSTIVFLHVGYSALFIPAALTAVTSVGYGLYHLRLGRRHERPS